MHLAASQLAVADEPSWQITTDVDLFAFSEAVSIDQFARDFDDDLVSGETAFTHDKFELGLQRGPWRLSYVDRFDYVTEFTEDTAFYHHSEQNSNPIPTDREYHLLLDVERARSQGLTIGYTWQANGSLSVGVAATYYFSASDLQSGFAEADDDVEPIDDELIRDFEEFANELTTDNRDLSPLLVLTSDIKLNVLIDYAYDEPKFGERFYQKPVITGPENAPLSGVDFSAPGGTGYGFELSMGWQATDTLRFELDVMDLGHTITWEDAPQSFLSFGLNAAIIDAIGIAQGLVDGEVVQPNDLVDDHLLVDILNADFDQHLPWRSDLRATWSLGREVSLFGWTPQISLIGGWYHTRAKDFPRFGFALDDNLRLLYDFGGKALYLKYQGKYGFAKLIADDLNTKSAHTLGIAVGINYTF